MYFLFNIGNCSHQLPGERVVWHVAQRACDSLFSFSWGSEAKIVMCWSVEGKLGNSEHFCLIPFIGACFRSGLSPGILCISELMEKGRSKWKVSSVVIYFKMSANYLGQVTEAEMNTLGLNEKELSQSRWKPFYNIHCLATCMMPCHMSQEMSPTWRKFNNCFSHCQLHH